MLIGATDVRATARWQIEPIDPRTGTAAAAPTLRTRTIEGELSTRRVRFTAPASDAVPVPRHADRGATFLHLLVGLLVVAVGALAAVAVPRALAQRGQEPVGDGGWMALEAAADRAALLGDPGEVTVVALTGVAPEVRWLPAVAAETGDVAVLAERFRSWPYGMEATRLTLVTRSADGTCRSVVLGEGSRRYGQWTGAPCSTQVGAAASSAPTPAGAGVPDGLTVSVEGRTFELVLQRATWEQARAAANVRLLDGRPGHLATFASPTEQAAVATIGKAHGWFAASDATAEGSWQWTAGREAGTEFWSGGPDGSTTAEWPANWSTRRIAASAGEPNQAGDEDCAHTLADGTWNDFACAAHIPAYWVEYPG